VALFGSLIPVLVVLAYAKNRLLNFGQTLAVSALEGTHMDKAKVISWFLVGSMFEVIFGLVQSLAVVVTPLTEA
jgi:multisubunit Na+/H+ antiporter MnhB subunit